jgi:hypothetical protein
METTILYSKQKQGAAGEPVNESGSTVTYLSSLGGLKRAPSDGPPGVKTIWIGLDKLNTLLAYKEWLV